jgi:hypothetical protein
VTVSTSTPGPNDFYIVTALPVEEHHTFEEAQAAREMMERHMPDKSFRIFRCKRWMSTAKHFQKLVEFLRDFVGGGVPTEELKSRARILLTTMRHRNELKFLDKNYSVPEFDPEEVRRS